ncbi:ferritin-like domain-containing protein [Mycena rosella]|uniref:Ferritin-like domain-containing protein n=1 Tax=Mycena rosella TaxID=1033263 RepID=A0AAD7CVZ7_MYCRO|nr:ferritin-like domain-containing protein [Mycena rosella]
MRYSSSSVLAALAAAPLLVSAAPLRARAATAADALVFQFANVLEQLETEFYAQGLAKFQDSDFTAAGFSSSLLATQTLTTIQQDEATHLTVIQQTLKDNGATPLVCNFTFDSALTDVPTLAATARVVEYVGVAAYLGGATIIQTPQFLDAAASILTVEARHQTVLNILSGTGSAIPSAFDIPLTPQEVLSIAGGFVAGPCDLGLTATNPLAVTNTGAISSGTLLTFKATNVTGTDGLFCNMMTGGAPFSINLALDQCIVPPGINGPVAIWITSDDQPLVNNVVDRATTQQVAGPAIIFIDSQPEVLGQMVRGSGTGSIVSTTTQTISPDQAASIIAGASATPASGNGQAAPAPASTPLPADFVGPSPDGKVTVNGLTMVPRPAASASASASDGSAPSSATDSSAPSATSADPSAPSASS